jgi:hypothetical protein
LVFANAIGRNANAADPKNSEDAGHDDFDG